VRLKAFDNGARMYDENKTFPGRRQWNSFTRTSSARSLGALCEIFATLGNFLNRTAIQH
jgi:hypothetical protein